MTKNDLDRFWRDDELAHRDNCFSADAPQVALGIRMSDETVFDELGVPGNPFSPLPRALRLEYNKRYNDIAERVVGRRLLREELPPEDAAFPYVKRIGEVFGGHYFMHEGSEWLESDIRTPERLAAMLDGVERMDLRAFLLPPDWEREKRRIFEAYGLRPAPMRGIRGPITLMCSIYDTQEFIYLALDEPDLARRFAQVVADVTIRMAEIMDEEAGTRDARGFAFYDDNCCLMTPDMYEMCGLPVLLRVFERFAPGEDDDRYQHSDSPMAHLLPLMAQARFTGVNFGPTVLVDEIRRYLPRARIDGCLDPLVFMRNERDAMREQLLRDYGMAKANGRGLNFATAGSINNGSRLESLRLIMEWIQQDCRY